MANPLEVSVNYDGDRYQATVAGRTFRYVNRERGVAIFKSDRGDHLGLASKGKKDGGLGEATRLLTEWMDPEAEGGGAMFIDNVDGRRVPGSYLVMGRAISTDDLLSRIGGA